MVDLFFPLNSSYWSLLLELAANAVHALALWRLGIRAMLLALVALFAGTPLAAVVAGTTAIALAVVLAAIFERRHRHLLGSSAEVPIPVR